MDVWFVVLCALLGHVTMLYIWVRFVKLPDRERRLVEEQRLADRLAERLVAALAERDLARDANHLLYADEESRP